ncbi:MAG: hypothetical protein K2J03_07350 [Muribaculaceae bacterium]|nr:hypothetical protein [Muribaculaceae bacterium]
MGQRSATHGMTHDLSTPGMFIYNQPFDTGVSTNRSNINLVLKRLKKGRTI